MKKLIAVAVVLVLVTGVAFADTSLGGGLGIQVNVIKGDNQKEEGKATKPQGGLNFQDAKVDVNFSSEKYGGRVRLYATPILGYWQGIWASTSAGTTNDQTKSNGVPVLDDKSEQKKDADGKLLWYTGSYSNSAGTYGAPFAYVWWKPVDLFRIKVGHDPDSGFGAQQIGGWGMNANAQDFVAVDNDSRLIGDNDKFGKLSNGASFDQSPWRVARSAGFYPGFSGVGVWMSIYPASIVDINLMLPYNSNNSRNAGSRNVADIFMDFDISVVFRLEGIGRVYVSFNSQNNTNDDGFTIRSPGDLWASFYFNPGGSLALDFGFGYYLPWTDAGTDGSKKGKDATTRSEGFSIGIGAKYTSGDFAISARVGSTLGKVNQTSGDDTTFGVGLLPSYNFGSFRAFFNTGFGVNFPEDFIGIRTVGYYVNPYVRVPAGGLNFYAGVKLAGYFKTWSMDGPQFDSETRVLWSVPIGIQLYL